MFYKMHTNQKFILALKLHVHVKKVPLFMIKSEKQTKIVIALKDNNNTFTCE